MTTTTSATPETSALPASAPDPVKRTLGTGAIIGIVVGGIALIGLLFGGGIAVGLAIPTGGADTQGPGSSEGGFPPTPGGGGAPGSDTEDGQRTRPSAPESGTNQGRPTAPNLDDTGTDDGAEEG